MLFAIDVETACTVKGCPDRGKSLCRNNHSLSPWHSQITVAAAVGEDGTRQVFRHEDPKEIAYWVKEWLYERDYEYTVCGQNFKFDWLHLARHGFEIPLERWVGDSQLAAYVLTEKIPDEWLMEYERNKPAGVRKAGKHSLKTLAPYFLGVEPYWEAATAEGGHDNDDYVLKDTRYTLELTKFLEAKLKDAGQYEFYKEHLLPWTKMLLTAEWRGVNLDMQELEQVERELQERSIELKSRLDGMWREAHETHAELLRLQQIERYAAMAAKAGKQLIESPRHMKLLEAARSKLPDRIDYDSPKQMLWLLRDYYNYDCTGLDGKVGTGREVLERLAEEGHDDVKTYLEWRKTNKILTAFLPTYKELAVRDESLGRTSGDAWALHPIYNTTRTRTGRTSSERPNVQQVPPPLRPLIKARPGYKFVGYDAAAIEAKLIALYSEDPTLYDIIDAGISIHDHNTKVFFGLDDEVPYSDVKLHYANQRAAAKNVGFALFYNAGANRIRIAFAQKGYHLTFEECKRLHERFKRSYSQAMAYSKEVVSLMEKGEVLPNLLGRPLKIEQAEDAYMQAFNTLIQSSASDLNLHGAYLAWQEFKERGIDATPLLFVHDFVCFEVREDQASVANEVLVRRLTDFSLVTSHGAIKLEVEGGIMDKWEKS